MDFGCVRFLEYFNVIWCYLLFSPIKDMIRWNTSLNWSLTSISTFPEESCQHSDWQFTAYLSLYIHAAQSSRLYVSSVVWNICPCCRLYCDMKSMIVMGYESHWNKARSLYFGLLLCFIFVKARASILKLAAKIIFGHNQGQTKSLTVVVSKHY